MGVSSRIDSALGMSFATTFVLTLSSVVAYLLQTLLLIPLDAMWLRTLAFIVAIAVAVQFTELALKKDVTAAPQRARNLFATDYHELRCFGCGAAEHKSSAYTRRISFYGIGAALGFSLVLILFAGVRERLQLADIPAPFQGASIALITAGFMALAFMGFTGMIRL